MLNLSRVGWARAVSTGAMALVLGLTACAPAAPASPTAAKPAAPTDAPKPAASPSGSPGASPAAKPAASPAASPAAGAPAAAAASSGLPPAPPFNRAEAEQFFRGKTLTITIGYAPGGGADTQGRLLGVHMAKHIPGNPTIAVNNLAGADSLVNAQSTARKAPDGLNIGHFSQGLVISQLLGVQKYEGFEPDQQFTYLGMVATGGVPLVGKQISGTGHVCARKEAAANLDAFLKSPRPLKLGETGPGANPAPVMEWLRIVGMPVEIVYGYGGTSEIRTAFDRGELEVTSRCSASDVARFPQWLEQDQIVPLFYVEEQPVFMQQHLSKYPWYKNVRDVIQTTPAQRSALDTWLGMNGTHLFVIPARTPANITAALQQAFWDTVHDPAFVEDMNSRDFEVNPISGPDQKKRLDDVPKLPNETLDILRQMLRGKS